MITRFLSWLRHLPCRAAGRHLSLRTPYLTARQLGSSLYYRVTTRLYCEVCQECEETHAVCTRLGAHGMRPCGVSHFVVDENGYLRHYRRVEI